MPRLKTWFTLLLLITGCNAPSVTPTSQWLGIPSACKCVMEYVNEGTNWVLNKNQVGMSKVTEVVPVDGGQGFTADYKISVTNGTVSFDTIAQRVACDKDGIPTEEAVAQLRVAVEDIKAKIKRLQN